MYFPLLVIAIDKTAVLFRARRWSSGIAKTLRIHIGEFVTRIDAQHVIDVVRVRRDFDAFGRIIYIIKVS